MTDGVHEWRQAAYKATRERDEARAAITRVRQVHHTVLDLDGKQMCAAECEAPPCPTIRALGEQLSVAVTAEATVARVREFAVSDALPAWVRERLADALDPPPPPCPRCHGNGKIPDWSRWDDYHGEPKPKPCPDCQAEETPA